MKQTAQTLIRKLVPTLYEDDYLLAVAKPPGVDVGGGPGASRDGLVEILADVRGLGETLQPSNRLSRDESGVLLLGKDPVMVGHVRAGLASMRIWQEYVGIVLRHMQEARVSIGAHHGTSRGKGANPRRAASRSAKPAAAGPRTTVSRVRQGKRVTLVRCRTNVRSTHALRAQLRSARLRLMGDHVHDRSAQTKRRDPGYLHLARISFHHPIADSKIDVTSPVPEGFKAIAEGRCDVARPLHAALVRRLQCLTEPDTDSYRLLTGDVEGLKGLVVEKYGQVVMLQIRHERPSLTESLPSIARWYRDTLGVEAVCAKRFARRRTVVDDELAGEPCSARPLLGKQVPEQIVVTERGLKFAIRPDDGLSVGLFLDHRDNRRRIRDMADVQEVLNLFAYTCSFSVAAAVGGAGSTVSVDLSPKHLEWGRGNFALNGLELSNHQFIRSDAFDYLRRAERQGKQFDLILLDPPSFAHGRKRGRSFSVARDLADLVAASVTVLRHGGVLMVSTNYRQLSWQGLRGCLTEGAGRRKHKVIDTPPLPLDFTCDPHHAKTMFVRFD